MNSAFFAYPVQPREIGETICAAITKFHQYRRDVTIQPWEVNDVAGYPVVAPIFEKISKSEFVAADITYLNENVAFEVGLSIGKKKRCLLFRNTSLEGDKADLPLKSGPVVMRAPGRFQDIAV